MRVDHGRERKWLARWSLPVMLLWLAACHLGDGPLPASPRLTDPTLGVSPESNPVGDPVSVHIVALAVGASVNVSLASNRLLEIHGAKHQRNQEHARVRVKVLQSDGAYATKLEVTTEHAVSTVRVERTRDDGYLLDGVYIVTRGDDATRVIAATSRTTAPALAILGDDDRAYVERFRCDRDRDVALASRALQRRALSRGADDVVDPDAWQSTTAA